MAAVPGSTTNAIIKVATTYGTAVSGGAGNKLAGELTPAGNVEEIKARYIGTGASFPNSMYFGATKPTISIAGDCGYRNNFDVILALIMGTAGAPTETTGGQADYLHTITWNTTLNAKYATVALDSASATVYEFPSCAVRTLAINTPSVPGLLNYAAELLGNELKITSTTNTNASMASATTTDTELINHDFVDLFRLNTSAGSTLAGGDNVSITSWALNISRPQDFIGEIKGSSGNGTPVDQGNPEVTLTITIKDHADHTWETYFNAQTALKCSLNIQGTQIGTGTNKAFTAFIPKMQISSFPQYAVTETGINTTTINFRAIKASANPSGMSSTYPYFTITNGLSTSLLV